MKRASSTFTTHFSTKKPTPVQSFSYSAKKSILALSSLIQALLFYWHSILVRDLLKKEMDGGYDRNNNDDKAINDNSLLEESNKDNNVQFTWFGLQIVLANSWFLSNSLYAHKTKHHISAQSLSLIITSISVNQNSPGANNANTILSKEKKS